MRIEELVKAAKDKGINLGRNPKRTIRYYIDIGLLQRPEIQFEGKVRRADFSDDHLIKLFLVSEYKKEGLSLKEIQSALKSSIYWTEAGLEFIKPYLEQKKIPDGEFSLNKPVTKEQLVAVMLYILESAKNEKIDLSLLDTLFKDEKGEPFLVYQLLSKAVQ